jgi:hypothetical protein
LPKEVWKKVAAVKAKVMTSRRRARKRQTLVRIEQMRYTKVRIARIVKYRPRRKVNG